MTGYIVLAIMMAYFLWESMRGKSKPSKTLNEVKEEFTSGLLEIADKMEEDLKKQQPIPSSKKDIKPGIFKWPSVQQEVIDYNKYIQSEEWKKNPMRIQTLINDNHCCRMCGDGNSIHVHHITYKNLRHERLEELVTLCHQCHDYTHDMHGQGAHYYPPIVHPDKDLS